MRGRRFYGGGSEFLLCFVAERKRCAPKVRGSSPYNLMRFFGKSDPKRSIHTWNLPHFSAHFPGSLLPQGTGLRHECSRSAMRFPEEGFSERRHILMVKSK